jgi:hypothetical protein
MLGKPAAMARAAAEAAASTLDPEHDRVGVISFADEPTLDLPMTQAGRVAAGGLVRLPEPDGNTMLFQAVAKADQVMRTETSAVRHVLLLTDGEPSREAYYTDLVAGMADAGITLSAVALGEKVTPRGEFLLKTLARLGRGRYFYASGPEELPRVATRDTTVVADERADASARLPRTEGPPREPREVRPPPPATPSLPPPTPPEPPPPSTPAPPPPPPPETAVALRRLRPHEALAGFEVGPWPSVLAPRPSSAARRGAVLLARETGEPVLAAGRPGLGRVAVWALPPDDPGFLAWAEGPRLLAQTVRSLLAPVGGDAGPALRVTHEARGDVLYVGLDGAAGALDPAALAVVRRARGEDAEATLLGVVEGEAAFLLPEAPASAESAAAVASLRGAAAPLAPPVAYLPRGGRPAAPRGGDPVALARTLGLEPSAAEAPGLWDVPRRTRPREVPLAPWALAAALALLVADVALHRRPSPRPAP